MTNRIILAFDTSTEIFEARLSGRNLNRVLSIPSGLRHAEQIAVAAQQLLANLGLAHIDAVAYARGPGSFTGLRIGAAFCKGLCAGSEPRLVSVPTLQAMVDTWLLHPPSLPADGITHLLPCIDGKKQRFYVQLYTVNGTALGPVIDATQDAAHQLLSAQGADPSRTVLLGPHAEKCATFLQNSDFQTALTDSGCSSGLAAGARAALASFQFDADNVGPQYYRLSQAEEGS